MSYIKTKIALVIISISLVGCSRIDNINLGEMNYDSCKIIVKQNIQNSTEFKDLKDEVNFYFTNLDDLKRATLSVGEGEELVQTENLNSKIFLTTFPKIDESISKIILGNDNKGTVATLNYSNSQCGMQVNYLFSSKNIVNDYNNIVEILNKQENFTLLKESSDDKAIKFKLDNSNEYVEISIKNSNEINIGYSLLVKNKK